jgi:2-keto-4-pentenoate hydratase/2-oxohepta-3-ene-1,7-dioic acid hydratase in catechol pathway
MRIGRIARQSWEGPSPSLVAVLPPEGRLVDLRLAERIRLERQGASRDGAQRVAEAFFPGSMTAALSLGPVFFEEAAEVMATAGDDASLPLAGATWLPPVDPRVMRDAMAFEQHMRNARARAGQEVDPTYYELPAYYKVSTAGLIGHEAEVPWPPYTRWLDYELELAFVIGREGRNWTPAEARQAIGAVALYDDFSARDIQGREMRLNLGPAKGKDFATAVGPWLTTTDELSLEEIELVARVNGEEWSRGKVGDMLWRPEELIAYVSWGETLLPGDLVGSGTVGFGCGLELGRRLNPGDVVELEATGVGVLRNRIGEPEEKRWEPSPRRRG